MRKIFIIAELGINHNGSKNTALKLIKSAAESGVNGIKFQYRNLSNAYSETVQEIGDEMLYSEIHDNYLEPAEIIELANEIKRLGIEAGISFFDVQDMLDFGESLLEFDFYKVPSAELNNYALHDALINTGKTVYISTGCHHESEIDNAFKRLPSEGWVPLHCISNYPVALQNSRLGYIDYLKSKWNRDVGYSSHDECWETCLIAMQLGVSVVERHITFDKSADGLDHTTSSTPDEFKVMCLFSVNMNAIGSGNVKRVPNQGELLNRQNLGRSFFLNKPIKSGEVIKLEDLDYRSPNVGLGVLEIDEYLGKPIYQDSTSGTVLTKSLFAGKTSNLPAEVLEFSRSKKLSLPIRLHDYEFFEKKFPINSYEFHLSYKEILKDIDVTIFSNANEYSIHLPDYISSTKLMDPFSSDQDQRKLSHEILEKTVKLAMELQEITGKLVPVVGSFSIVHENLEKFYEGHGKLIEKIIERNVMIMLQWLPPIAWYFGGSVQLNVMNQVRDMQFINKFKIPVCMDVCHLFMGRDYYEFSPEKIIEEMQPNIKHLHIADSAGIDGEGLQIGDGDHRNIDIIKNVLDFDCLKVIEVWQGHLDQGAGFKEALQRIYQLYND